ncbi:uncharacterized protein SAPINGB_P002709 [Magnusiomyces paraingens]|uniref:Uncharacterized protein n=1 Tax=Magnusiomyces paraingens TaxID=2606893 RepID=A0A5E8BFM1_9ASCO|nr:uncharacterized protein SAPINGB_P002709 [Saprochaete ingens]VVT50330.1 unnamed protein product [Saprochaete ingens]
MRFIVLPVSSRAVYIHCVNHNLPTIISSPAAKSVLALDPTLLSRVAHADHDSGATPTSAALEAALAERTHTDHGITVPARKTPRLDDRLVARAAKIWAGFEESQTPWKRKLVKSINSLLERLPYEEAELRAVPSKSSVLRKLRALEREKAEAEAEAGAETGAKIEDNLDKSHVSYEEEAGKVPAQMHPISVYYPASNITPEQAFEQIRELAHTGRTLHLRRMLTCLALAPLTLPIAMLPVIPNVPGIYLMYRAWCNFKALEGARHLELLVDGAAAGGISPHLNFKPCEQLDLVYRERAARKEDGAIIKFGEEGPEKLVLDDESTVKPIEFLVEAHNTSNSLHSELLKAIHQTRKKIESSSNNK